MSKKIIWIIVIILIVILIFAKIFSNNENQEEFKPIDKNIGDEFTEISYPNKMYIVNYEIADVTGDAEKDMILLIGESKNENGSGLADNVINNLDVVVYDGINKKFISASCKNFSGKANKILTNDFNGDQVLDIMILCDDNDEMKFRIYTYDANKLNEIWKERNNKGLVFTGNFLDGFKIKIVNKKLNFNNSLDIVTQKEQYVESGLYNNSGKLMDTNKEIHTSGLINVETIKLNDRCGIRTIQRIYGIDKMDIIDEITSVWKYKDGKWQMVETSGLKLGNLLY